MNGLIQIEPKMGVQRWALGFVGGKDTGNVPKSCFVCPLLYINQKRCQIHGPDIVIDSVVYQRPGTDDPVNQLWTPVCTYQRGGTPRAVSDSEVVYNVNVLGEIAAKQTGLEWAKSIGTNCDGFAGGAPCEHFVAIDDTGIDGNCDLMSKNQDSDSDSMSEHKGQSVDWDDCCNGHEGEHIDCAKAQELLQEQKDERSFMTRTIKDSPFMDPDRIIYRSGESQPVNTVPDYLQPKRSKCCGADMEAMPGSARKRCASCKKFQKG